MIKFSKVFENWVTYYLLISWIISDSMKTFGTDSKVSWYKSNCVVVISGNPQGLHLALLYSLIYFWTISLVISIQWYYYVTFTKQLKHFTTVILPHNLRKQKHIEQVEKVKFMQFYRKNIS